MPATVDAYVLRTHYVDDVVLGTFQQMQRDLGAWRVFMLFDDTKTAYNGSAGPAVRWNIDSGVPTGPAVILINEVEAEELNPLLMTSRHNTKIVGSGFRAEAHVVALKRVITAPFRYLWMIEYDVYCHGSFAKALAPCHAIDCDYLSDGLRTPMAEPNWCWWGDLYGGMEDIPLRQRRGCFFPISRYSRRFLVAIEQHLGKSTGFCEIFFPTLCHVLGMDIGVIPASKCFGTFEYRPALALANITSVPADNLLYHPVKGT